MSKQNDTSPVVLQRLVRPMMIFGNLNVAAFDESGKQIPELQKSVATLMAEHIERCGYDPDGIVIETQWGCGWRLFKTQFGTWNHEQV